MKFHVMYCVNMVQSEYQRLRVHIMAFNEVCIFFIYV